MPPYKKTDLRRNALSPAADRRARVPLDNAADDALDAILFQNDSGRETGREADEERGSKSDPPQG